MNRRIDARKDYYAILGVAAGAEDVVVNAAFRALAQRYHPDRHAGSAQDATARMAEINEAHTVLADTALRAEYDRLRLQLPADDHAPIAASSLDSRAEAEVHAFHPFADKLRAWGYDEAGIAAALVGRGLRRPVAEYLARLVSGGTPPARARLDEK